MKTLMSKSLNSKIDKIINSIQNSIIGEVFHTEISAIDKNDLKQITRKKGWLFDWNFESKQEDCFVYKLNILNNPKIIQGIISLSIRTDHIFINLIENSPFNRGKNKLYIGVPGNLIAFACKLSVDNGFEGFASFISKSQLVNHYRKILGAKHIGGNLMVIDSKSAKKLINNYFDE